MAPWVKTLCTKPVNLNSIPQKERSHSLKLSSDRILYMAHITWHVCTHRMKYKHQLSPASCLSFNSLHSVSSLFQCANTLNIPCLKPWSGQFLSESNLSLNCKENSLGSSPSLHLPWSLTPLTSSTGLPFSLTQRCLSAST